MPSSSQQTLELTAVDNATATLRRVQGSVTDLTSSYEKLKGTLLGLSAAVGATYFARMIASTIEAEAALLRLSERTGNTVEALSSLTKIAKLSNTDMDQVASGMQKLAKSMAEAESGTGKAGKVFEALGISIRDTNTGALRPTQDIMQELGQKLSAMKDQTLAVAFAQEILGKNGAALLPFLYELSRAGELHVKVTTEQAQRAKEFEDNLVTLKSASMDFWRHLANDMLPTLNRFTEQLIKGRDIAGGWFAAIRLLGSIDPSKSIEDNLAGKERELADWKNAGPVGRFFKKPLGSTYAGTEDDLKKQIEYLKYMRSQDYQDYLHQSGAGVAGLDSSDVAMMQKRDVANPLAAGAAAGPDRPSLWTPQDEELFQARKKAWEESEKISADFAKQDDQLAKDKDTMWKQVYKDIDDEQQRAIDDGAKYLRDLEEGSKRGSEAARELGMTFASAFEDAVISGKKLQDVLNAIGMDVARIILRKGVTEPAAGAIGDILKDYVPFAQGGVMTSRGAVPLRRYAGGGVADSPQLAMFGEGDTNEAYVPLPDGKRIPVQMSGQGVVGHTFIIDARGADRTGLANLQAQIAKLDGSIEFRAVSSVRRAAAKRGKSSPF